MTPRRTRIACFGEALIDFLAKPTDGVDTPRAFHQFAGGAPANVAVGLGRLGVRVGLMTLVGPDEFGRFVRDRLASEGVDTSGIGTHPRAKTGVTFVSVAAHGERSFLFFRHPSADQQITADDVDPARVVRARVLHLGSSTLSREPARGATRKALAAARAAGMLVSTDPNLRMHLWDDPEEARAMTRELVAGSDLVKVSEDELGPIVGVEEAVAGARALRALGAKLAIVTLGPRGSYYDGPAGAGTVPAAAQVDVVDSTGAGDAFVAGVLARLAPALRAGHGVADLDEAEVRAACALGNRMGACAVTRMGATAGLPPRGTVSVDDA